MMRIHFYANAEKPQAASRVAELSAAARRFGLEVTAAGEAETVVVLGGDGTFLRAARTFPGVPLLGLNFGGLGYLSSVGEEDFADALKMLADGNYSISERTRLEVRKIGSDIVASALNDVVATREMSGHAAVLELAVDSWCSTRYLADGLVFATPTGSTAYSLSAGGPVLMPDTGGLVVTPMNPHALGVRSLVVKDSSRIVLTSCCRADGRAEKIGVYADGENVFMLDAGESMEIVRSSRPVSVVELADYDPYSVLSRKLGWAGACAPAGRSSRKESK
jgi:NAD+ kinase